MLPRLFTCLLLLTLFFPGSVLGGFGHRCQPTDKSVRASCCQEGKSKPLAQAPYEHLSHRCDAVLTPSVQQLVNTGYKYSIDNGPSAEAVVFVAAVLHFPDSSSKFFSAGLHLYCPGNGPPVFLRNCSVLI